MAHHRAKLTIPSPGEALPGRDEAMSVPDKHHVKDTPLCGPFDGFELIGFGMGCFWGAERVFWEAPGVYSTAVGYAGGHTPNPTYEEVCSGRTGHTEIVQVAFDSALTTTEAMLSLFWENHDPTQGMKQGADVGTQYRSAVYASSAGQQAAAERSRAVYQRVLSAAGRGAITTEIRGRERFYFAEAYHQQYLAKNPGGYCGHGGTGLSCPVGWGPAG